MCLKAILVGVLVSLGSVYTSKQKHHHLLIGVLAAILFYVLSNGNYEGMGNNYTIYNRTMFPMNSPAVLRPLWISGTNFGDAKCKTECDNNTACKGYQVDDSGICKLVNQTFPVSQLTRNEPKWRVAIKN